MADEAKTAHAPHLFHTKDAFKAALKNAPAHEHDALAKEHGWHILDIACACGNKVPDHVVDTRSKIEDDLRVKPCLKCGARGAWTFSKAVKPPAPIPVKVPDAPQTEPTPNA